MSPVLPPEKDPTIPFEMPIQVQPSDIDMIGHVNNTVYLRWVQEAATSHWDAVAHEDDHATMFWLITRHEIDYKRPAFEGEKLIARTWVGYYEHHKCERFTEIIRVSDNRILINARTIWCPVSQETKRTVRLTEEQIARYSKGHKPD
ncbi:acyl-CoA thioesterase [uncultured Cohaesibacter sp.]|uniref:acyl-CoA thioesterase n=1 Tax=uncultured Cohaesibacter sp. TaxID=1002546 RepID=UPI002D1E477D|nr:acyl-CoA thioesterase [uncultured Cohaesibacter sp.]